MAAHPGADRRSGDRAVEGRDDHRRLLLEVTGGGSQSRGILQVFADVFGATLRKLSIPNSAALGAALEARLVEGWQQLLKGLMASSWPPSLWERTTRDP